MRIEGRELEPHTSPVLLDELRAGSVYFSVNYIDDELLVPIIETLVFIGKNLEPADSSCVYFQDVESYRQGVRYQDASENEHAQFYSGAEDELNHIFHFEQALEELMRCLLRRQRGLR